MKVIKLILMVLVITFTTACVHVTKPLSTSAKPSLENGYLYGKFNLSQKSPDMDIVLIVKNTDQEKLKKLNPRKKITVKKYGLRFHKDTDIYTVAVEPGTYQLKGFEYGTGGTLQKKNESIAEANGIMSKEFTVLPGQAYYMGDWYGSGTITNSYPMIYYSWKLDKVGFELEATTQLFLQRYKQFNLLPQNPAFHLDYSDVLERGNPDTYTLSDLKKAVSYSENDLAFKMANHLKDSEPDAEAYLGRFYEKGIGVEKSFDKALELYSNAIKRHSPLAMWTMGIMFNNHALSFEAGSEKRKEFNKSAFNLIERSAIYGHPNAVALQCERFSQADMPQDIKNFGVAWCQIGKKLINDENRDVFKDTPVVGELPYSIAHEEMVEISKLEDHILNAMKNNNVVFTTNEKKKRQQYCYLLALYLY
jgi:hypothetical protein